MSVLIKGMDMPKEGELIVIRPDGKAYFIAANPQDARETDVTSVPPHGRLIEAEPLETTLETFAYKNDGRNYSAYIVAKAWVKGAPTIIPAEEGE